MLELESLDEALHRRIRPRVTMLVDQPVEHPLRRVTLLRRATRILHQPSLDHLLEPAQDPGTRPCRRRRWDRREITGLRVLDHRIPTHTQYASDLTPRHTLPVESPDIFYNGHGYRHLFPVPSRRDTVRKNRSARRNLSNGGGPMAARHEQTSAQNHLGDHYIHCTGPARPGPIRNPSRSTFSVAGFLLLFWQETGR